MNLKLEYINLTNILKKSSPGNPKYLISLALNSGANSRNINPIPIPKKTAKTCRKNLKITISTKNYFLNNDYLQLQSAKHFQKGFL